jgi:hypothetical protein
MTKQQKTPDRFELNGAVKALAARDRLAAVAILDKFGVLTTADLQSADIPAAHAAFLEALGKFEAGT